MTFVNAIKRRHVNYAQIVNIINSILKPQLSYLMQITMLKDNKIKELDSIINKIVKHKVGIASNISNDTLYNISTIKLIPI